MSIFDDIGRLGAALRNARRNRKAIRELNALPPELQKDIGWPSNPRAQAGAPARRAYWDSLR